MLLRTAGQAAAGDFFGSVPAGGDAYVLKWIIYGWDHERAVTILRNCRRVMSKQVKLLFIEAAIPPTNAPSFHKFMLLNISVMSGGHGARRPSIPRAAGCG